MKIDLALDIGGTHMRAAVFHEDQSNPSRQKRIPTYAGGQTSLDRLVGLIREVTPSGSQVRSIAIGIPGTIDPNSGAILTAPNIPDWVGIPVARRIEAAIGAPAILDNDANMAALGEWQFGAGQGHNHLVYLTISTGIGGGVICDGQLLRGKHGMAGELGHVTILPEGPVCSCGRRGHLEALSSGPAIMKFVAEQLKKGRASSLSGHPDPKSISLAAQQGDFLALEAFQRAGHYLGLMIANYLMIFNPSIVILGGGVSQTGELLLKPIRKTLIDAVLSKEYIEDLRVTQAALGDDAGLYGALVLARQSLA